MMFVSASEPGGYPGVLGWGCATQKSKIAYNLGVPRPDCEVSGLNLDQLGPTLFCIE